MEAGSGRQGRRIGVLHSTLCGVACSAQSGVQLIAYNIIEPRVDNGRETTVDSRLTVG